MRYILLLCLTVFACTPEPSRYHIQIQGLEDGQRLSIQYLGTSYSIDKPKELIFAEPLSLGQLQMQQPEQQHCRASQQAQDILIICLSSAKDIWGKTSTPSVLAQNYSWFEFAQHNSLLQEPKSCSANEYCVHTGLRRTIHLPGLNDCTGIIVEEALDAFVWACINTGGSIKLTSIAFKPQKGLMDLIDSGSLSWKNNHISIRQGSQILAQTPQGPWWNNPIVEYLPGTSLAPHSIYLLKASIAQSIIINTDNIALLVLKDVELSGDTSQTSGQTSVLSTDGHQGLWIEGLINANNHNYGIHFSNTRLSTLHNITVINSTGLNGANVSLKAASNNWLSNVKSLNSDYHGIALQNAQWNRLSQIAISQSANNGLVLLNSNFNFISGANISNGNVGIELGRFSLNNILQGLTISAHDGAGIWLNGASNNMLMNITTVNNGNGLLAEYSSFNHIRHVLAHNNQMGIILRRSNNNTLSNLAFTQNGDGATSSGLLMDYALDNYFTGHLYVGGDQGNNCSSSPFLGTGITDNCAHTLNSDFWGPVTIPAQTFTPHPLTDSRNSHGQVANINKAAITDWLRFDNDYRSWGKQAGALVTHQRGWCRLNSQSCQIWDWRLPLGDHWSRAQLPVRAGNAQIKFVWQVNETECTALQAQWDGLNCISPYLRNAYELAHDGIGNDNYLCESGENCLFTGNMGSYQGHGTIVPTPYFQTGGNDGLRSIVLFAHINNGI